MTTANASAESALADADRAEGSSAASAWYDVAFARRTATLDLRAEGQADHSFLCVLFVACSPLQSVLPRALLEQQAAAQRASHMRDYPDAMRRVAIRAGEPIGRLALDWTGSGPIQGVDVAVLPEARASGVALALLRAWTDVADRLARPSRLSVLRDNPAARIYKRLGFRILADDDGLDPVMRMERPPRLDARRGPSAP